MELKVVDDRMIQVEDRMVQGGLVELEDRMVQGVLDGTGWSSEEDRSVCTG